MTMTQRKDREKSMCGSVREEPSFDQGHGLDFDTMTAAYENWWRSIYVLPRFECQSSLSHSLASLSDATSPLAIPIPS